jgi:hypothetical protein
MISENELSARITNRRKMLRIIEKNIIYPEVNSLKL